MTEFFYNYIMSNYDVIVVGAGNAAQAAAMSALENGAKKLQY